MFIYFYNSQIYDLNDKKMYWFEKCLRQWFLTFFKSGNTFDYMKNLRNTKINDPKNKQKHPA